VLADIPAVFMLVGLGAYIVLAGADFGAGFWQLTAGRGDAARRLRDHAHDAMGPVWETNHVWLVFVVVVCWTAYPSVFGSIASTLSVPLFLAALGIILRGAGYALRAGAQSARELAVIDTIFGISSVLTPFALGTIVGGVASGRVPLGNAAGSQSSSWLNPTSIEIGVLAVSCAAYLAAVYMAADAHRAGEQELAENLRRRALGAGAVSGAVALAGIAVLHSDARRIFDGLTGGAGLVALLASGLAGALTLLFVTIRRYERARYCAATAVAAIVAGWGIAQQPQLLPGLSVRAAAAPHATLVGVVLGVAIGAIVLIPSLLLLFRLFLRGRLEHGGELMPLGGGTAAPVVRLGGIVACLIAGVAFLTIASPGWAHAIGVLALAGFVVLGVVAFAPAERES
jgi:cytochrome d ubiquinol oxidase subunit II